MSNEFVTRYGIVSKGDLEVTGSTISSGGFTGSLMGSSSYADNATYASESNHLIVVNGQFPLISGGRVNFDAAGTQYIGFEDGTIILKTNGPTWRIGANVPDDGVSGFHGTASHALIAAEAVTLAPDVSIESLSVSGRIIIGNSNVTGTGSLGLGHSSSAAGNSTFAHGDISTANGFASHAEGSSTSQGTFSHSEGENTVANGETAHSEGYGTTANGFSSHAEGDSTIANGETAHSEGSGTTANGYASHTEGESTIAIGDASHAEGLGTIASGSYQHVQGTYNNKGNSTSLFIIGNGSSNSVRSDIILVNTGSMILNGDLHISQSNQLYGTASYALTASHALNNGTSLTTGSTYPITASWSNNTVSASIALTASYVSAAAIAGQITNAVVSASFASSSISASFASIAANANAISFVPTVAISASQASSSISSSFANTASNSMLADDLTFGAGKNNVHIIERWLNGTGGGIASRVVFAYTWNPASFGSSGTYANQQEALPHFKSIQISTGATFSSSYELSMTDGGGGACAFLNTSMPAFCLQFVFKVPDATSLSSSFGVGVMTNTLNSNATFYSKMLRYGYNGYYVGSRFNFNSSSKFEFVISSNTTSTATIATSSIALDTNWHMFNLRRDGNNFYFSLDNEPEVLIVDSIGPASTLAPQLVITTSGSFACNLRSSYCELYVPTTGSWY